MTQTAQREWSARRPVILGCVTLAVLFLGFGSWGALTPISGAIVSSGRVEAAQNRFVVQHPEGGVITEIRVQEGDSVRKDDLLIRLDTRPVEAELAITEAQLYEIQARIGRFLAERDGVSNITFPDSLSDLAEERADLADLIEGQVQLFETRQQAIAQSLIQQDRRKVLIGDQITGIAAQRRAVETQLQLLGVELHDQEKLLRKGLSQASRVLVLRREDARLNGLLGELDAEIAAMSGRMAELDLDRIAQEIARKEEAISQLRDLRYREFELLQTRSALLERIAHLEIRAPAGGQVFGLAPLSERAVIQPALHLMSIVSRDQPLLITSQIRPGDIDELRLGQQVLLRFSTLNTAGEPELNGEIAAISGDVLPDKRTGQNYYRIEIALSQQDMARAGVPQLVPGMPFDTFIRTGDRSVLAYILEPFTAYFRRAFRET